MTENGTNRPQSDVTDGPTKLKWQTPQLTRVGTMAAIVRPGAGKTVPSDGDPGDNMKPRGIEPH